MNPNALVQTVVFCLICAVVVSLYHRSEGIKDRLGRVIRAEVALLAGIFVLVKIGQPPVVAVIGGLLCALVVDSFARPRSRYIRKTERRKAIARFELDGRKYNPRRHHLDHIVPFSKGGSNTADNLQVLEQRRNRAKGAKSPWWDLLGR